MRLAVGVVAAIVWSTLAAAAQQPASTSPTPPVAKKIHTERTLPGGKLVDDYGWLRERTSPEVHQYLEQENAYAEQILRPLQKTLYSETLSHIKQTDDTVPYRKGAFWYYTRTVEGKQYRVFCRRKFTEPSDTSAPEEVLLDLNQMAVGEKFMAVGAFEISDDGNLLAYTTDNVGFRQYALHVKDLHTGQVLPDTAARVTSVSWAADGKTLFYVTEDATTKRSDTLFRHTLGAASADPVVFEEKDERFNVDIERTRDRKYLLLGVGSHITSEFQYLAADAPTGAFTVIEPRKDGVEYSVDEGAGLFYIVVNDTGRTFRLVTAPVATPGRSHWAEVIASRPDVPLNSVEVFRDFYAVTERPRGLTTVRVVSLKPGVPSKSIAVPEPTYALSPATNAEFDTPDFRYGYTSLVTPPSTYSYSVRSGQSTLLKQVEVPGGYNKAQYTTERLFAIAKDGTRIPISLVYRTGKFTKGSNALFQTAYGSYGYPTEAHFNPIWLPMLDRGVVIAIAHIRGGGELGLPWHDGGKMMTKRNTFTDFTDSTEFLLKEGYGAKGRVGIEGASAGGLLMGAVTNMRPDLYKVVLAEVPFVDVMNTMLDPSLPLTVSEFEEWGNPSGLEAFRYMRTYSPYDNVEPKPYPAILVETSFDDSQVMYWEPAKYVAKLRATKTDAQPLVFLINMHGGHGGSSGRYDSINERCLYYAFLLHELNVT